MKRIYPIVRRKEKTATTQTTTIDSSCTPYYHDTTYDPIGLWQFSGSLADSSTYNNTLRLITGVETYTEMPSGFKGILFDGDTTLDLPSGTANFYRLGDITIEAIVSPALQGHPSATSHGYIVFHGTTTDLEAANTIYSLGVAGTCNQPTWFSEHAAGQDDTVQIDHALVIGGIYHLAVVKESNVIRFLVNGSRLGPTSSLTAPTGGTTGRLQVGQFTTSGYNGSLASLKIIPRALTDAEVKAEFDRTLGAKYTIVSAT